MVTKNKLSSHSSRREDVEASSSAAQTVTRVYSQNKNNLVRAIELNKTDLLELGNNSIPVIQILDITNPSQSIIGSNSTDSNNKNSKTPVRRRSGGVIDLVSSSKALNSEKKQSTSQSQVSSEQLPAAENKPETSVNDSQIFHESLAETVNSVVFDELIKTQSMALLNDSSVQQIEIEKDTNAQLSSGRTKVPAARRRSEGAIETVVATKLIEPIQKQKVFQSQYLSPQPQAQNLVNSRANNEVLKNDNFETKAQPILANVAIPLSVEVEDFILTNKAIRSLKSAVTAVGVTIASVVTANWRMQAQLKNVITNTAYNNLVATHGCYKFLVMSQDDLLNPKITQIAASRAGDIVEFSKAVIHKTTVAMGVMYVGASFAQSAYEPNTSHLIELAIKTSGLVLANNIAYIAPALGATVAQLTASYGIAALIGAGSILTIDLYSKANEFFNDAGYLKASIAYQDISHAWSAIFPTKELELDIANKDNLYALAAAFPEEAPYFDGCVTQDDSKTVNSVNPLNEQSAFKQTMCKLIYNPFTKENNELSQKIVEGELTQVEASALQAKHVIITLETRAYSRCVEQKDIVDDHKQHYYCYDTLHQLLDHVIIGSDNSAEYSSLLG